MTINATPTGRLVLARVAVVVGILLVAAGPASVVEAMDAVLKSAGDTGLVAGLDYDGRLGNPTVET